MQCVHRERRQLRENIKRKTSLKCKKKRNKQRKTENTARQRDNNMASARQQAAYIPGTLYRFPVTAPSPISRTWIFIIRPFRIQIQALTAISPRQHERQAPSNQPSELSIYF